MPRVIIPSPFRKYTDNQREVIIGGESLKETMEHLLQEYPALEAISDDSALLSIFINSRLVRIGTEDWGSVVLNGEDEVTLIIPIAGG